MTIYFLGGGNMAEAIVSGMVKQGGYAIHVVNRGVEKRERLAKEYGVTVSEKLPELCVDDVLVLAVKPQDMQDACVDVQPNGALVVSVAAGLSVDTLSRFLHNTHRIVRVMPNTPSKIGLGVSGLFAAKGASVEDKQVVENIMKTAGMVVWLPEEIQMHSITGISGSGSAYVFYLLNALKTAAEEQGFNAEEARALSLATFKGAVELAEQTGEDFAVLQRKVTSKGGTTHEAIETFKALQVSESINEGVKACVARSQEMAQQFEKAV